MSQFIVSARKYRPARFSDVVGQEHVTRTLQNAIRNEKLGQAFLFCGPRGVGKTTCARILARTINCENLGTDTEACGTCASCKSFNENTSFNIHELDAASNNSVEDIRSLVDQVRYAPQSGKYKIYIIDEVHMLSQAAFNAFLKTLEEPPAYAKFILATTEKHKILPTILSRCQIFDFRRIKVADIIPHLEAIAKQENITYEADALHLIAQKADGALRDALTIFDRLVSYSDNHLSYQGVLDSLNILDYDYYFKVTEALLSEDRSTLLQLFDEIQAHGFEGDTFLSGLAQHFRDLLICKDPGTLELLELGDSLKERYRQQSGYTPSAFLLNSLHLANRCELDYRFAKHKRLHVELALLRMCYLSYATEGKALASETDSNPEKKKSGTNNLTSLLPSGKKSATIPEVVNDEVSLVEEPGYDSPETADEPVPDTKEQPEAKPENHQTGEVARPKTGGRRARSSLLLQHEEKPGANPEQSNEGNPSGNGSDKLSTLPAELLPEVVMEAWTLLADHMESSKSESLGNAIRQYQPVVSGQEIRFTVGNKVLHEMAVEAKMSMVSFLNQHLPAGFVLRIDYDTSLVEGGIPDRPLTEREKHEELQKKYPNLRDLENQLGLDLEY